MSYNTSAKIERISTIALTTGGTTTIGTGEYDATNITTYDDCVVYRVSGTQTLVSNYALSPTGTAYTNIQILILWEAVCTPSGNTVTIFGETVPTELVGGNFVAQCTYNGSAWVVVILPDWAVQYIIDSARIKDGAVTTAKTADKAMTVDKMADLTSAQILVGDASNRPAAVAMSGDVTMTNAGVVTIGAAKVLNSMINSMDAAKLTGTVDNDRLASRSIGSLKVANISYKLDAKYSDTGTTAVTTEEALYTYVLPAGTLANNGESVQIEVAGYCASNANAKTIKVKVGTNVYVTNSVTTSPNSLNWRATVLITRSGASGAVGISNMVIDTKVNENVNVNKGGITWANDNTITVTGQNGTASANDIVCSMVTVTHIA